MDHRYESVYKSVSNTFDLNFIIKLVVDGATWLIFIAACRTTIVRQIVLHNSA